MRRYPSQGGINRITSVKILFKSETDNKIAKKREYLSL